MKGKLNNNHAKKEFLSCRPTAAFSIIASISPNPQQQQQHTNNKNNHKFSNITTS